jgi:hypothetical protein
MSIFFGVFRKWVCALPPNGAGQVSSPLPGPAVARAMPDCQAAGRRARRLHAGSALLCAALAVLGGGAFRLAAQNRTTGEVRGTLADSSGAVVPGAQVVAVEEATQLRKAVNADSSGTYLLGYLAPGTYTITFTQSGFKSVKRSNVIVHAGDVLQINVIFEVGAVDQSIVVTSDPVQLEMESATRSTRMVSQTVLELPNVGRSNQQILLIIPGASYGSARANGGAPGGDRVGISGQRAFTTNFTVDGGAGTFPQSYNADNIKPPLDSTEEISVSTNNFNAEYGNGGAVFSVISKGGTNQFHGALYEFNQNDIFGARSFFAKKKSPLRWNQFGGNVGGPIVRNKMFFFFAYEGSRSASPSDSISTVPTAATLSGDFGASGLPVIYDPNTSSINANGSTVRQVFANNVIPTSRLDSVAQKAAAYWPTPSSAGFSNNYYYASGSKVPTDMQTAKYDYAISSNQKLSISVLHYSQTSDTRGVYPGAACNCSETLKREWQVPLSHVWTIRPSLLNELRLSFLREEVPLSPLGDVKDIVNKIGLKNVPAGNFPTFSISGYVATSLAGPTGFNLRQNSFWPADTVTYVRGRHIIKAGVELQKQQVNNIQPWHMSGSFGFSGIYSRNPATSSGGLGLADFLLGLPGSYTLNPAPDIGERFWSVQSFVQDDYKLRSNLTLSVGVRYHARSGWSEAHNQLSNFDPSLTNPSTNTLGAIWYASSSDKALTSGKHNLFAPRLGVAWSPSSKMSVRAGYGVFFVPLSADTYSNQNPAGYAINMSVTSTDSITPIFQLQDGAPAYSLPSASTRTASGLNGQSISYWPRDLKEAYTQQWHLSVQRQITPTTLGEIAYVGTKGTHLVFPRDLNQVPASKLAAGNAQLLRPYPQFQGISTKFDDGDSIYHAVQTSIRKTAGRGLTLIGTYTFSKTIDNSSYDHTTGNGNAWQIANRPDLSRALSQLDVPHTVTAAFVYELPVGKGRTWLNHGGIADAFLGGWQLSGVARAESGIPFTPTISGSNLSNSLAGTWLPNRLGNGNLSSGQRSISHWFDTSAFAIPSAYTFGNSGRDILRGPKYANLDIALAKSFAITPLGERGRLQARADFSNALNHANFNLPDAALGSSSVGTITGATGGRNIQMGLKLMF